MDPLDIARNWYQLHVPHEYQKHIFIWHYYIDQSEVTIRLVKMKTYLSPSLSSCSFNVFDSVSAKIDMKYKIIVHLRIYI